MSIGHFLSVAPCTIVVLENWEPLPLLVYKWCQGISNLQGIWDKGDGFITKELIYYVACDIIFLLGCYFYHTSYDTVERILYALHLLIWYRFNKLIFLDPLSPKPFLRFIQTFADLEASKHAETIFSALQRPSLVQLCYKMLMKGNLMKLLPSHMRVIRLFSLIN